MLLVKEKLEANRPQKDLFLRAIAETDWSYELSDIFHHLVEDVEDEDKSKNVHIESIIQIVNIPGLEDFYKKLEGIIGEKIMARPTHITLYTFGNQTRNWRKHEK